MRNYTIVPSELSTANVTVSTKDREVLDLYGFVGQYYYNKGKMDSAAVVLKELVKRYNGKVPAVVPEYNIPALLLATGNVKEGTRLLEECSELYYRSYQAPSAMYGYQSKESVLNFVKNAQSVLLLYGIKSKKIALIIEQIGG